MMLRGFALGSLALIGLWVVVQQGTSNKTMEASNVLLAGMKRLLDPSVAGLANRSKTPAAAAPNTGDAGTTPKTGQAKLPTTSSSPIFRYL